MNQVVPKDDFKITKGQPKVYEYMGDSGTYSHFPFSASLPPLLPSKSPTSNNVLKALPPPNPHSLLDSSPSSYPRHRKSCPLLLLPNLHLAPLSPPNRPERQIRRAHQLAAGYQETPRRAGALRERPFELAAGGRGQDFPRAA